MKFRETQRQTLMREALTLTVGTSFRCEGDRRTCSPIQDLVRGSSGQTRGLDEGRESELSQAPRACGLPVHTAEREAAKQVTSP